MTRQRIVKSVFLAAMAAAGAVFAAGCMGPNYGFLGPGPAYRDVMVSREEAYDSWLSERKSEQAEQALIKGKLSMADALKLALDNNKSLQAAMETAGIAKGELVEAVGQALPQANADLGYTRTDKKSVNVAGTQVNLGPLDHYSAGLTVSQPLFRGGATLAGIRAARVFTALTNESIRGTAQQVINDVANAYYAVLLAQQLVVVQSDGVEAARQALADVQKKKAAGVATQYDILRAQVQLSNFQAAEIQERNQVNRDTTVLLNLMGVSQDSSITLSDELTYKPMDPVFEEAVHVAYQNRPDLLQAELQVRLQREALNVAYSRYYPTADAFFTEEGGHPDPHTTARTDWGNEVMGGVTVNWTLFDGFQREGNIMVQAATLRQNKIQIIDTEEHALQEIKAAILSIQDADEFIRSQSVNLESAREAQRLAQVGYQRGVRTQVEVYDAQAATTQALANYYQALYGHTVARLALQKAMGILGPLPGQQISKTKVPVPAWIEEFMVPVNPVPAPGATPAPMPTPPPSPAAPATKPAAESGAMPAVPAQTQPRTYEGHQ